MIQNSDARSERKLMELVNKGDKRAEELARINRPVETGTRFDSLRQAHLL